MSIDRYGALLHAPWERGSESNRISCLWAEDSNEFEIIVPDQLRDLLIYMQNELSIKYTELNAAKRKVVSLESESKRFFPRESK